jgi:FKBP-type peptidyl-prolyl cis-trans isomerase FkpA
MKIKNLLVLSLVMLFAWSSCVKKDNFDPAAQAELDEALIVKFIADNNISAIKHPSGLYYQIIEPGVGTKTYAANTIVSAKYAGRLLNGSVFDQTTTQPLSFPLGNVIVGWQIGVPLIQKGGKIRLLIPSQYGYGPNGSGKIPANAVLDFDVELIDVQ